jgi:beta-lactamase superfamily II metal-dependent hydrolase
VGRAIKGCGCALAVLAMVLGAAALVGYKYVLPWWRTKPPPPSGELQVHILDVGPIDGDSILIISPTGKNVLIDAGDTSKSKVVLDALKRYKIQQLDYFVATHPHPDHIGGAAAVIKAVKVLNVIDNGLGPATPATEAKKATAPVTSSNKVAPNKKIVKKPTVSTFYDDYEDALKQSGSTYEKAEPGTKYDLGGGARLTILGPTQPYFTKEHLKTGGNEPNANSVVMRLDYGDFSMLLPGDAEEQTEQRMMSKDVELKVKILKVAHHGSKYATSADFLKRVQPEVAIISDGEWNRYGHPAQAVLDRLKNAKVKVYRTDLQGEITIATNGKLKGDKLYEMKTAKEAKSDVWTGREAQKDDSSRSGFIAYGDFGPPPKAKQQK